MATKNPVAMEEFMETSNKEPKYKEIKMDLKYIDGIRPSEETFFAFGKTRKTTQNDVQARNVYKRNILHFIVPFVAKRFFCDQVLALYENGSPIVSYHEDIRVGRAADSLRGVF